MLLPYYAVMHVVAEATPGLVVLRLPSVGAGVAAVVFTALVGCRLWSRPAGLVAGLALALNGTFIRLSIEARPGAVAIAACAASTWALLRALENTGQDRGRWVWYSVLVAGGVAMQPFSVLVVPAQALLVLAERSRWKVFAGAVLPALAVSGGLLLASFGERSQVAWIPAPTPGKAVHILSQVAGGRVGLTAAVLAAALVLICRRTDRGGWLALGFVLVPVLGLLLVSAVVQPVLVGRYLSAVPLGVALLLGAGVHTLGDLVPTPVFRRISVGVATSLVLLCLWPSLSIPFQRTRGDNFPAVVALLQHVVRPRDRIVVHQGAPSSGFLAGIAAYAGDPGLERPLRSDLVFGLKVDAWQKVERRQPLRTGVLEPWGPGRSIWYVARISRGGQVQGWRALAERGCTRTDERHIERTAVLRLRCP